jgi:hypothetical protein
MATMNAPAPTPAPAAEHHARRRRAIAVIWPLAVYTALSLLLFGVPVLGHLGSRIIASDQLDSSAFMWFYAWWPHALLHGVNPFVTHAMFVPQGYNLQWATSMPLPSIVMSPVTLAFGPAVTWNLVQLAAPALSAWTAFLLCRRLTGRTLPSLVGGYLFGFSSYMLIHLTGGPSLALVALVPVFVALVLRRLEGSLSERRFMVAMTLALTAQYLTSTEILATSTLFGAAALVGALALFPQRRAALTRTIFLLIGAYVATAVLVSPFLYFFFVGHHYPPGATFFSADLASFVLPPALVEASRHIAPPFQGSNTENYLGAPLMVMIAAFIWQRRRSRGAWLLVGCLIVAAVLSLGRDLYLRGHRTSIALPWKLLVHLPVLRYAVPVRFALFVILPAAMIAALWLSLRGPTARWILAAAAIVCILPDVGNAAWNTPISDPVFFSSGAYRAYLKPADDVLTVPAWGPNERWQADTGFAFSLSDGYAGNPLPASYTAFPTWNTLLTGVLTRDYGAQLRRFVSAKRVTAIVVDERVPGPWSKLFGTLGVRPLNIDGVLFYRLPAHLPAAARPPSRAGSATSR